MLTSYNLSKVLMSSAMNTFYPNVVLVCTELMHGNADFSEVFKGSGHAVLPNISVEVNNTTYLVCQLFLTNE